MKFTFYLFSLYVFLFSSVSVYGQEPANEKQHTYTRKKAPDPHFSFKELSPTLHHFEDSLEEKTLADALRKGFFSAKVRNFLMFTDNQKGLQDFYANGFGMGLHYKSKNCQITLKIKHRKLIKSNHNTLISSYQYSFINVFK